MELEEKDAGGVKILRLTGRLDAYSANEVEKRIAGLIDGGCLRLVMNLEGVEYISSSGLRVMLAALKRLRKLNGELGLACLRPYVKEVFDIAGFTQLFAIYDREAEAVARCTPAGK